MEPQAVVASTKRRWTWLGTLPLALASGAALAHPGHEVGHVGFVAGLGHPWLGLDHLLAMAAIGLWSLKQAPRLRMATPLLMVLGMVAGAGLSVFGVAVPGVEYVIALSVLLVGILLATYARVPASVGAILVIAFMMFHGYAHGSEMPMGSSLLAYIAGFTVSTLVITMLARHLGTWLMQREQRVLRVIGGLIAACGAFFAFS